VKSAEIVVVLTDLGEDGEKNGGAVVTRRDDVGALSVAEEGSADALEQAVVVVGLAISAADRVVVAGAVALSRAGLHGQSDLAVAKKHAVAFIGSSAHGADWLEIKRAVANLGGCLFIVRIKGLAPSRGQAGSLVSYFDFASLQSALVSVCDAVNTAV